MKRKSNDSMKNNILDSTILCMIYAAGSPISLSQIASSAGISERTLNRYFPDKEMLLYEAAIRYLQQNYCNFARLYLDVDRSEMTGLDRFLLLIRMQAERNQRDMVRAKVFVRAYTTALRTAVYKNLPITDHDAPVRKIVLECIEDGIRDGSMRSDVSPMDTYFMVSSNYMGLVQRLIYFYSVDISEEEHKKELLLVFNKYIKMIEEYLSAEGRRKK